MNARDRHGQSTSSRLLGLGAAVVLTVALTACGGGGGKTSHHNGVAAKVGGRPIFTMTYYASGNTPIPFRVSIYDLRREGPFLVLDFGLTCLDPNTGCDTQVAFTGPKLTHNALVNDQEVPSGVWLVDPVNHQEYRPVRDGQDRPFVSRLPISINDAAIHLEWARYAAPPPGASSLDIAFPDGGPQIPNVPITSGPGPTASAAQPAQPAPFAIAPGGTDSTGLTMPVESLQQTVGNPVGSDTESSTQSTTSLHADVLFKFAKSNLTPAASSILAGVARQIKSRAVGSVTVTGYTDSIGSDSVNLPLSRARAQAVVQALRPFTPGVNYTPAGKGSADPVAPNSKADGSDNPTGRALNRRVTISYAVRNRAKPTPPPAPPPAAAGSVTQGTGVTFTVGDPAVQTHSYQATPTALFREGDLLVLRMTLACQGTQNPSGGSCDIETDLASPASVPPISLENQPKSDATPFFTVSAFYMLDPASGSEYVPIHSQDTYPLTGRLELATLEVGHSYQVWAYFPAPPSSTSSLTLVTPGGTRLGGVPIAATPPPQ